VTLGLIQTGVGIRRRSGPPALQANLFLDEFHDPVQVLKVDPFVAAHVVYGAAPGDNVPLAIQCLVPDTNYK